MSRLTVDELKASYKYVMDSYIDLYTSKNITNPENRPMLDEFRISSMNISKSLHNCKLNSDPSDIFLGYASDVLQKLMNLVKQIKINLDRADSQGITSFGGFKKPIKKVSVVDSDPEEDSTLNPFDTYPAQRTPKKMSRRQVKNSDSDTETEPGDNIAHWA